MSLNIKDKKAIVAEVKEVAKSALSAVIADSCGLTVNNITELRKKGREIGIYIRVIRNTLMRRIVVGTQFECLKDKFVGQTMIAFSFSNKNPGSAARLLKLFSLENKKFSIKVAAFKGEIISASKIDFLADMPTYEEAIARLISTIKEASIAKLVRILAVLRDNKKVV